MKELIRKWLGFDQVEVSSAQVEQVVERLLAQRYDLEGNLSAFEDYRGKVDDLEWKMDELREYDLWDMSRSIEDHTSAIETLEQRLDAIYSPEGYEVTLTAKVKGVQDA